MSTASVLPPDTRVGRVWLRVADIDRQRSVYEDVVGLEILEQNGSEATLGIGNTALLTLIERPDLDVRSSAETGLFHTAFRYPTRAGLGDALNRAENQWELTGASDHLVSEALYLDDPEGNGVELYRDRPTEEWPVADDGRIEMATLPLDREPIRTAAAGDSAAPDGTDIGHIHLEVSDVTRAHAFYVDTLGLGLKARYGEQAIFMAAGNYHHHVGANNWNGRTEPATGLGLDRFELLVPDEVTLGEVRERLSTAGYAPTDQGDGIAVHDADEIEIKVTVDR